MKTTVLRQGLTLKPSWYNHPKFAAILSSPSCRNFIFFNSMQLLYLTQNRGTVTGMLRIIQDEITIIISERARSTLTAWKRFKESFVKHWPYIMCRQWFILFYAMLLTTSLPKVNMIIIAEDFAKMDSVENKI